MNKTFIFIAVREGNGWAIPHLWGSSRKHDSVDRWELLPSGNARFFASESKTPPPPRGIEDFLHITQGLPEELK